MPDPDITIYSDSSTLGCDVTNGKNPSARRWIACEVNHTKGLELKNIIWMQTYCKIKNYNHARVMSDNTTAITDVNTGVIKS